MSSMRGMLHLKPGNAWEVTTVLKIEHEIQVEKEQTTMQVVELSIFLSTTLTRGGECAICNEGRSETAAPPPRHGNGVPCYFADPLTQSTQKSFLPAFPLVPHIPSPGSLSSTICPSERTCRRSDRTSSPQGTNFS